MELTKEEDEFLQICEDNMIDGEVFTQEYIDEGNNIDVTLNSQTGLILACKSLQYDIIKILLKNDANMYHCDKDGNCAFIYILKKYTEITTQFDADLDSWYVENELRKINRMSDDEYKEYIKNPIINQYFDSYDPSGVELSRLVKRFANRTYDGSIEIIDSIIKLFIDSGFDINFINNKGNSILKLSLDRGTYENNELSEYFYDYYATRKLIKLGCNTNELRLLPNIEPIVIDWINGDFNEEHPYIRTRRNLNNNQWANIEPVPE
jgi:ankyrin repeat protein